MRKKKALVIHSGGMDSSLCLALALREFGNHDTLSLSFTYQQRHSLELEKAAMICREWGVEHAVVNIDCLQELTDNALMNSKIPIEHLPDQPPNTLVTGRNGLMARLGAIHAHHLGVHCIYMGVMEIEEANSGYRDCSRAYMDLKQEILRQDLADPTFEILTPLVKMTKKETLELAEKLGILNFLLKETITCYEGLPQKGCMACPACKLRNEGIRQFSKAHPEALLPY
ncbi:MAG: 7-cyano-7-deazaguanine synthase [Chlamydiae bacterium]|nr:7-cyano-7-deazaguanine synthase [Chlamydiota bacterium]